MPPKGYKTVNIREELFEKMKTLSNKHDISNGELLDRALSFFDQSLSFFDGEKEGKEKEEKEKEEKEKVTPEEPKEDEARTSRLTRPVF